MSVCLRCSRHKDFGGCCSMDPTDKDAQMPLSRSDIERIQEKTGLDPLDFAQVERISSQTKLDMMQISPYLGRMTPSNLRFKLKLSEGTCVFLEDGKGCTLKEARPTVCKIFPFWPTDTLITTSQGCMALYEGGTKEGAMDLLNMTPQQIAEYTDQYLAELQDHEETFEELFPLFYRP